jgi:penicillin-binding protein 1A
VGFTPGLVAGAWIGFDNHEPLGPRETGAGAALPAWLSFMRDAGDRYGKRDFEVPGTVEYARIDPSSGLLAADPASPDALTLPFVQGTVPTRSAAEADSTPQNFFMD